MSFDIDIKYEKNADIFYKKPTQNYIMQYTMTNKYLPLIHRYTGYIKKLYPKYYEFLKNNNPSIILYNNVSPFFLISHIVLQRHNNKLKFDKVYLATSNTGMLEAILYQNVGIKNDIRQIFLYDCNTDQLRKEMYDDITNLRRIYGPIFNNENATKDFNSETINKISKQHNNLDLFIYTFFNFEGCKGIYVNEYQHFYYTLVALKYVKRRRNIHIQI